MSIEKEKIKVQNFYVQQALLTSLINTKNLLKEEEYEYALRIERGTIRALPNGWRKLFNDELKAIDTVLTQADMFEELDPIQFRSLRRQYIWKEGGRIANHIDSKLWDVIHRMGVFDFINKHGPDADDIDMSQAELI